MILTIPSTEKRAAVYIRCILPLDDQDDVAPDFPGREPGQLVLVVNLDTGKADGWPAGRRESLYLKPVDEGRYELLDSAFDVVAIRENDYVPRCLPGEYGDYFIASICADGTVLAENGSPWMPRAADVAAAFFGERE